MIKETVTIDDAVELLNSMVAADPDATQRLVTNREECNKSLANHPTIQVGIYDGKYRVGLVGILNGLFGINKYGWGVIAAIFEKETGKLVKFIKLPKDSRNAV